MNHFILHQVLGSRSEVRASFDRLEPSTYNLVPIADGGLK